MSDATQARSGDEADLNALLDFYANDANAGGHVLSLSVMQLNATTTNASVAKAAAAAAAAIRLNENDTANNFGPLAIAASEINNVFSTMSPMSPSPSPSTSTPTTEMPIWLIPSYSIILLCAIVGNSLVISTLVQNRRMRTITNLFLLNLAISDMLLGVLCMPVTLVGTLLRNFIFGEFLCKLIQFSQAASVAVSSWTLVAISCERYYAICHPLRSRSWQTMSHAYRIIGFIWLGGIIWMMPIAVFSQLIPTSRQGYRKCRENWPRAALGYERFYNMLLDLILLVLPLMVLCVAYILITRTLYVGMNVGSGGGGGGIERVAKAPRAACKLITPVKRLGRNDVDNERKQCGSEAVQLNGNGQSTVVKCVPAETEVAISQYSGTTPVGVRQKKSNQIKDVQNGNAKNILGKDTFAATDAVTKSYSTTSNSGNSNYNNNSQADELSEPPVSMSTSRLNISPSSRLKDATLRRSNEAKTLESKKRVVKMLFVLVLEFFICWTPLYVINTTAMFLGPAIYEYIDYTSISFLQLLAYSSSCCNPITYCFMNASFRRAFVDTFKGLPMRRGRSNSNVDLRNTFSSGAWHRRSKHELVSLTLPAGNAATNSASSPRL